MEMFKILNTNPTKSQRNRKMTAIAFVLLIAASALLANLQFASAKDPSWAFISVVPKTAKVNTEVLITGWTTPLGRNATTAFKTGYVVTVTNPEGTKTNITIDTSYEDSTFYKMLLVDKIGTWSVVLSWPGDGDFSASVSPPYNFTVAQDVTPVTVPQPPMPSGYWTRPVYADIRGMALYLGSWPQSDYDGGHRRYNPASYAPNSAHILWTSPGIADGIIGGEFGDRGGPDPYAQGLTDGIPILMGKAYYTYLGITQCIDMATGNIEWTKNFSGSLTFGFLPDADRVNSGEVFDTRGISPAIFVRPTGVSGRIDIYNAFSGNPWSNTWIGGGGSVTDSRIGISAYHNGFMYYVSGGNLLKWDPAIVGDNLNATSSFATMTYQPKLVYRKPIPSGVSSPSLYDGNIAVSSGCTAAFNLTDGTVLYSGKNYFTTADGLNASRTTSNLWEGDNTVAFGIYTDCFQGDMRNYGFNITTGELAWYTEPRGYPYGTFNSYSNGAGNGKFFVLSYDGHIYAYNATNGKTLWAFSSGDAGSTKAFGTWPFWTAPASADGKVYASTGEHSQTNPRMPGDRLYCINDTSGKEIWSITGMWGGKSIADSKLLAFDGSDGLWYCFGKGPTAVTVSVPETTVAKGSPVLIKGTVTDQSPGQKGAAAVSETSMTAWMEYLHMYRAKPTNATGVQVRLIAIDPTGKSTEIGWATTDLAGIFKLMWTPTVEGAYTIIASYGGSESYFPSDSETALGVGPAATTPSASPSASPSSPTPTPSGSTPAPTTPTPSPSTTTETTPTPVPTQAPPPTTETPSMDIYIITAAVIVIVAVVAAAIFLKRRK